jgi:hypothetical protein
MSVKKRADIESLVHSLPLYSIQWRNEDNQVCW